MECTEESRSIVKCIKEENDLAGLVDFVFEDSVLCSFCGKTFADNSMLNKHQLSCKANTDNRQPLQKICSHCGKIFSHNSSLHRHETNCRDGSSQHKFKCPVCFTIFGRIDNYRRHCRDCNRDVANATTTNAACKVCHKLFSNAEDLEVHTCITKKKHLLSTCLYDDCKMTFYRRNQLTRHLRKIHGNRIEEEKIIVFGNVKDFFEWKLREEQATFSCFTKRSGTRAKTDYYYCQLDGSSKPHCKTGEPARKTNRRVKRGTTKKDRICLAKMKVKTEDDGSCQVVYQPTHSHKLNINEHLLNIGLLDTVKYINEQLSAGISPKKCLQTFINGALTIAENRVVKTKTSQPVLVTGVNTLALCKRIKIKNDKDDAISVMIRVALLSKEHPNPVILYKPLGADKVIGPNKVDRLINNEEVFILGIQTKEQRNMMLQGSRVMLSINWTDDTNTYGYRLLTLVVPDEHNRGYPVAFFILNDFNESTVLACLISLKENCANLVISSIILPDNALITEVLHQIFGANIVYILCLSGMYKIFEEYLNDMAPKELVFDMYQFLCIIIECEDKLDLKRLLEQFIETYSEAAPEFIKFLKDYYLNRIGQWTMAYRKFPHANIDTTIFNEFIHNKIISATLKETSPGRLDDLISILLDMEEDYYKNKYLEESMGIPCGLSHVLSRHTASLKITDNCITQLHGNIWEVADKVDSDKVYEIVKFTDSCTKEICYFTCNSPGCDRLCSHLYACTCEDKNPLCHHIHKLHAFLYCELTPMTDKSTQKGEPVKSTQILHEKVDKIKKHLQQLSLFVQNEQVGSKVVDRIESRLQQLLEECKSLKFGDSCVLPLDSPSQVSEQKQLPFILSNVKKEPDLENCIKNDKSHFQYKREQENCDVMELAREEVNHDSVSVDHLFMDIAQTSFTPSLDYANLYEIVIKTGTEELSLLDLKSLDPFLTNEELTIMQQCDKFNKDFMCSTIINSFLLQLQLSYTQIVSINSDIAFALERIDKAKTLFTHELLEKDVFIMPMNLSNKCWTCFAIFIKEKEIIYFNPLGKMAKDDEKTIMNLLSSIAEGVEWSLTIPNYDAEIEDDTMAYGVHVCHFAEEIAMQTDLTPLIDINAYRRHIYDSIVGDCLKRELYQDLLCGKCNSYECPYVQNEPPDLYICCSKCNQWYHNLCIEALGIDVCNTDFTCLP